MFKFQDACICYMEVGWNKPVKSFRLRLQLYVCSCILHMNIVLVELSWEHVTDSNLCQVTIGSDNGLLLSGNTPPLDTLLTRFCSSYGVARGTWIKFRGKIWRTADGKLISICFETECVQLTHTTMEYEKMTRHPACDIREWIFERYFSYLIFMFRLKFHWGLFPSLSRHQYLPPLAVGRSLTQPNYPFSLGKTCCVPAPLK